MYNRFLVLFFLKNLLKGGILKKFKLCILIILGAVIVMSLVGCGTIEGLRKDIRTVGKVLGNA